jgi:hypothetical protein
MGIVAIALPALIFLLCLFIHAALWRLRFPADRAAALFCIFVFLPFVLFGLYALLSSSGFLMPSLEIEEWLAAGLLQLAFASAYIMTYPAFEALSPSLVIVLLAFENGGIAVKDLSGIFSDEALIKPRIKDLLESKLAREDGGVLSVTEKGRLLAAFFVFMRSFLGLPKGGG